MKIGVFDSGIGGMTVLSVLREAIPQAEYVYLGDTANVPYGTKSPVQVAKLSVACAERLKSLQVDAVVVACNTASSLALTEMRQVLEPTPVFGVVQPGIQAVQGVIDQLSAEQPSATASSVLPVLVLATRATVKSQAYGSVLSSLLDQERNPVFEQACPLLVPLIEEGWVNHPVLDQVIAEYVGKYRSQYDRGVALLGCTHYPWIQSAVERALPGWTVINSAQAVARALQVELAKKELASPDEKGRSNGKGSLDQQGLAPVQWVFTDPDALPENVRKQMSVHVAESFSGEHDGKVTPEVV